jgi:hypothetical protein
LNLSPPSEISRTAVDQLALPCLHLQGSHIKSAAVKAAGLHANGADAEGLGTTEAAILLKAAFGVVVINLLELFGSSIISRSASLRFKEQHINVFIGSWDKIS